MTQRFVITGGPGAGKSTLVAALERAGRAVAHEAGRAILRQQAEIGGQAHAGVDPLAYAEAMLQWDMRSFEEVEARGGAAFFDRGIPDTIGYLRLLGRKAPAHMWRAAELFRYDDTVFVAPPWEAIFVRYELRDHGFDLAIATHDAIRDVYTELGYALVDLPMVPVDERLGFILAHVADGKLPAASRPLPLDATYAGLRRSER